MEPAITAAVREPSQAPIPFGMTVDVEDYFHASALRHVIKHEDWDRLPSRVEQNTEKVLDLLAEHGVRATFFILGWVAERFPTLVQKIHVAGHELGCHSHAHRLVYELSREEFRADTQRALQAIEDAAGIAVRAYRGPSFSITPRSIWAIEILLELGFTLDSSIFPIRHDLYGFPGAPEEPFQIRADGHTLIEFPPPTFRFGPCRLPVTGGGYLRLLPMWWQLGSLRSKQQDGRPVLLYFHPWELDPAQPRFGAPWRSRFRHYTGLSGTSGRLCRLLSTFRFGSLSQALSTFQSRVALNLSEMAKASFSVRR